MSDFIDDMAHLEAWLPYTVECARCGASLPCTEAVAEEGDEWECFPCNDRCNAQEKAAMKGKP